MSLLEFYVNLRRDILAVIGGVKDSGHSYRWDKSRTQIRRCNVQLHLPKNRLA